MPSTPRPNLNSWQSVNTLWRAFRAPVDQLTAEESASTLFRFFRSKHVVDLRLIFSLAVLVLIVHVVLVVAVNAKVHLGPTKVDMIEFWKFLITYIGPGFPVYSAIVTWAYLSASARLGIVDLFACEISTLCRVGTIVDVGKRFVEQAEASSPEYHAAPSERPTNSANFVSQENYFPIFASNSKDLQALEAMVVTHITEFYTFMKAARDSLRKLGEASPPQAEKPILATSHATTKLDPWHDAIANVIFMMFLGYESARKAVKDLIEYEPTAAENIMVILITELKCYCFLLQHFKEDELRHSRLKLRELDYRKDVPDLFIKVKAWHGRNPKEWERAWRTIPELEKRYKEACLIMDRVPPSKVIAE